jgi:hypothetical protein
VCSKDTSNDILVDVYSKCFIDLLRDSKTTKARVEKQRPEPEQKPSKCCKIGRASPRTMNDQKLLLHEQAVSDNGPRTAGPQEFGDCS